VREEIMSTNESKPGVGSVDFVTKRWQKFQLPSKALFVVATFQVIMMLIIAILTFVVRSNCPNEPCKQFEANQAIALFLWTIFFYVSVLEGLFWGNMYELYAAMFVSLFVTAWSVWRKIEPNLDNYLEYMFVVSNSITQIFYFSVSWALYKEYRWVLWKKAGSDLDTQNMYTNYLKWSCFQKLDMTFAGYCILFSGDGVFNIGWKQALDWSMAVLLVITIITGYIFVRKEWSLPSKLWFLILPVAPAYVIALFVLENDLPKDDYSLYIPFRLTGALLFISRIFLVYYTVILIDNYGKGLIELTALNNEKALIDEEDEAPSENGDYVEAITHSQHGEGEERESYSIKDVIDNTLGGRDHKKY